MLYRSFIIFVCCFHFVANVLAQDCHLKVSGHVIDEHDRQPLSFAEVFIPSLGKGAVADDRGAFSIEGLCPGSYTLRVSHLGCSLMERTIDVQQDVVIDFRLEHHAEQLHEAEIVHQRPDENVGHAHEQLDAQDMDRSSGRTLGEMLATIAGVNMLSSGPTISKPVIHGLSGNRILTLNQGIRQEDQQWGTEHAPNLDPFSSDRITVVKGAASVQYGSDALGGVVITEPVALPRVAGVHGELRTVGMLNGLGAGSNALVQGGLKGLRGWGWRMQGSGRFLGDSRSANYVLSNTGAREAGGSAAIGYRDHRKSATVYYSYFGRELGILRAAHIGNLTDLNNAIQSGQPFFIADRTYVIEAPQQVMQHHLLKVDAGYAISERDRLVLTYGYQADARQEFDIRRGGRSDIPALDLFLFSHTGDAVLSHWIGRAIHGKAGVSGVYQENLNLPGTGVRPLIPNYRKQSGGVFLLEHLPLGDHLELEAGARMEATQMGVFRYSIDDVLERPEHHFLNNAVSVGANCTIHDSLRVRFNLSSAYRPPNVSELYSEGLHHGAAAVELGDPALASERSLKGVIDLEATWLKGIRTDLTVYADRIMDYIYLRPAGVQLTVRGAFPVFQYVATDAFLYGTDATLQLQLLRQWALRSRTSIVRGWDLVQEEWLYQMPSDRSEHTLLFTPRGNEKWHGLELGVTHSVVLEQTRIPTGLDFTDPPATYNLIGLFASAVHELGRNELRFGLRAGNIFNASYRDYMDRFRYYADARGTDLTIWITYAFGKEQ